MRSLCNDCSALRSEYPSPRSSSMRVPAVLNPGIPDQERRICFGTIDVKSDTN
jgi:hypothetical protein